MKISLRRVQGAHFEARNEAGQVAMLDGPPSLGGQGAGVRPMEMVLMGLAGCSALDVLLIMQKQRQPLRDLDVFVEARRADAVPAVFTEIEVTFEATGEIDPTKLERAVQLSMEKYCSVAKMLERTARITHRCQVREDGAG